MDIPKLANGGSYAWAYTSYKPTIYEEPSRGSTSSRSSKGSSSNDNESDKLADKLLLKMLDSADMLDNEREYITNKILRLLNTSVFDDLYGINTNAKIASLVQINSQMQKFVKNKKEYDKAVELAIGNQSLNEPAIDRYGRLAVISEDGNIEYKDLSEINENMQILTVNDIKRYRDESPDSINNNILIDIIHNSVGLESFLKAIDTLKVNLGTDENSVEQTSSSGKNAKKGLDILELLKDDPNFENLSPSTIAELNKYKILDKTQENQLKHLVNYIVTLLPKNYQTWAAYKLGTSDRYSATKALVEEQLLSTTNTTKRFSMGLNTAGDSKKSGKSGESDDISKLDSGWWTLVQSGEGGTPKMITITSGKGNFLIEGRSYGQIPGIDSDMSLTDFINKSNGGHMISNREMVTIGDIPINQRDFNKVLIENTGATVVALPITPTGRVRLEIVDEFNEVMKDLKNSGLTEGTPAYKEKLQQLCEHKGIGDLIDYSTGKFKESKLGSFLIVQGMVDNSVTGEQQPNPQLQIPGGQKSFKDILSNWIIETNDESDIELYKSIINKDFDKYQWYNPFDYFGLHNYLYKGNIYIPLSINPLDALNADKNKVKRETADTIDSITYNKIKGVGSANSDVL